MPPVRSLLPHPRPIAWRDCAILLRSPRGKSEIFAKEFERAGIPLAVARGGFYQSAEILDLLSLLQLSLVQLTLRQLLRLLLHLQQIVL